MRSIGRIKNYFMTTGRIGFSTWGHEDLDLASGELIGCCGVRPFPEEARCYEIGFHLRSKYWGMGYASEGAEAVIEYSFHKLKAKKLYAGHHPQNEASKKVLAKLGFRYIGDNYYEPTGLYHPSYEIELRR